MLASCAYCDAVGPLTKEHVWPECFLSRMGREAAHFSHQSGRAHGSDYVVGDVCENCNNSLLSKLDVYFCQLYDEYFAEARRASSTVRFAYDYDLLARALLKISYNSARAAGSDDSYLRPLRAYILLGQSRPTQLAVFGELVSPTVIIDPTEVTGVREVLPSGLYRTIISKLLTPRGGQVRTRVVAVNSFYFHLAIPARSLSSREFEEAASEIATAIPGVVRLSVGPPEIQLSSSPQDAISTVIPHVTRNMETYQEYFRKRRAGS